MTPFIDNYVLEDYDEVWTLHRKTVSENDGFVKNLSFHTDLHDILNVYEAFFIMREAERLVGMVGLKRVDAKTLEIKRLQIAKECQGRGYARRLMSRAFEYAKANNISNLCLDVSEPQVNARQLYLSLGFEITRVEHRTLGGRQ
ncbi:MAG: GNAT family N-acetyltransferase [Alphaproteobacteria bacterium]|nr:GNAT family N-acetyltransferase [Alphaproteobacteria bacterium]